MLARTFIFLVILLNSCAPKEAEIDTLAILKKDGVSISITPSVKFLRTCDLLELTIEANFPQEFKLKLPDSKSDFGDFQIFQIHQNSPIAINEKMNSLSQVIILEPGLPASHKLAPLKFTYWDSSNAEKTLISQAVNFKVISSINTEKHTEIEDIITSSEKPNYTVTITGTIGIILTLIYVIYFSQPEKNSSNSPANDALVEISKLKELSSNEIIQRLPKLSCGFLKERFSLTSPDNLDVIIDELSRKQEKTSEELSELLKSYNSLRYGKGDNKEVQVRDLLSSFESVFQKYLRTAS